MGAEHGDRIRRHFGQILDEDRALVFQAFDNVFVVHDLVPDIDRRSEPLEGKLDDLDRTVDAGAEAAGSGDEHAQGRQGAIEFRHGAGHVRHRLQP